MGMVVGKESSERSVDRRDCETFLPVYLRVNVGEITGRIPLLAVLDRMLRISMRKSIKNVI